MLTDCLSAPACLFTAFSLMRQLVEIGAFLHDNDTAHFDLKGESATKRSA